MKLELFEKSNLIKRKRNGFTLLETVISVSILGFVFLAISAVIIGISKANINAKIAADTITSKEIFGISLTNYLKNAINLDWTSAAINNVNAGRGLIRRYQSGLAASATAAPLTMGLFLRDEGLNQSDIRGTAFFFKEPTANTPGTLLLSSTSPGSGTVTLNSNMSEIKLESVVELTVEHGGVNIADGQPARVIKITTVQRYFSNGTPTTHRWCPARLLNTAPCRTDDKFSDVTEYHYITLNKNLIDTGVTISPGRTKKESIHGDIYLFKKAFVAR